MSADPVYLPGADDWANDLLNCADSNSQGRGIQVPADQDRRCPE